MAKKPRPAGDARAPVAPRRRGRRGPAPDPERANLMPVLYRVKPEQYEALSRQAEERAARRWEEEVEAAKREGRSPRPLARRKDASEVLRDILEAWLQRRKRPVAPNRK